MEDGRPGSPTAAPLCTAPNGKKLATSVPRARCQPCQVGSPSDGVERHQTFAWLAWWEGKEPRENRAKTKTSLLSTEKLWERGQLGRYDIRGSRVEGKMLVVKAWPIRSICDFMSSLAPRTSGFRTQPGDS